MPKLYFSKKKMFLQKFSFGPPRGFLPEKNPTLGDQRRFFEFFLEILVWLFWSPWKINQKNGLPYCFTYWEPKKSPRLYKLAPLWSSPLVVWYADCWCTMKILEHSSTIYFWSLFSLFFKLYFVEHWYLNENVRS